MAEWQLVDVRFIPTLASGVSLLLLAGWLVWIDFANRLHRAFAVFLLFLASVVGLVAFSSPFDDLEGRLRMHAMVGAAFAALYFVHVYQRKYAAHRRPMRASTDRLVLAACIAAPVASSVLLASAPWYRSVSATGQLGPIEMAWPLMLGTFSLVALVLAREVRRLPHSARRRSLYLSSLAFTLYPMYAVAWLLPWAVANRFFIGRPGQEWLMASELAMLVPLAVLAACVAVMLRHHEVAKDALARQEGRFFVAGMALPMVTGLLVWTAAFTNRAQLVDFVMLSFSLSAMWTLAMPLLVAYAMARHELFDVEVHAKWLVSRGAVTGVFVLVFVLVTEIAQNLMEAIFQSRPGIASAAPVMGLAAAGLMLLALHPLQRAADRISTSAVPKWRRVDRMAQDEQVKIYREQAELAWSDGNVSPKERAFLERLRLRLGINRNDALALESEIRTAMAKA